MGHVRISSARSTYVMHCEFCGKSGEVFKECFILYPTLSEMKKSIEVIYSTCPRCSKDLRKYLEEHNLVIS